MRPVLEAFMRHPVAIGLVLRLLIAWLGPHLLDSGDLIPGVAYTDVDYHVFSDAADHVRRGESPYDRHTYRYTPFLAMLMARLPHQQAGRVLFCLADTICGWIILNIRQNQRARLSGTSEELLSDVLWWLYNPFAINICTRGSAESFLVLLPVLSTLWIVLNWKRTLWSAVAAGVLHGLAIHNKLYPIIYSASFAISFISRNELRSSHRVIHKGKNIMSYIMLWVRRLVLEPRVWLFLLSGAATFAALGYASYRCYGWTALQESLLYHFSRVDHRHNYSMHWYSIYLAQAAGVSLPGLVYFVPQVALLALLSLGFAEQVPLALFLETLLFVSFNKVITAQYFVWYLCLLPLCSDRIADTPALRRAAAGAGASVLLWLGAAYRLEMMGRPEHRRVWLASLLHFVANVGLLRAVLRSVQGPGHGPGAGTDGTGRRKQD